MRKLLALALMLPLVALALAAPPKVHKWQQPSSSMGHLSNFPGSRHPTTVLERGRQNAAPMNRDFATVRMDTMIHYMNYLWEPNQGLIFPGESGTNWFYFAYNDNYSSVLTKFVSEDQLMDGSWIVDGVGVTAGYVSPGVFRDGSFVYPQMTLDGDWSGLAFTYDEFGIAGGGWTTPWILDGIVADSLPLTVTGQDNIVYLAAQARELAGDSHYFISFDLLTGILDPPGEVLIFPSEEQYGENPVYGQGYENSQILYWTDGEESEKIVIAAGGYRSENYAEEPLLIVYKESTDKGNTWSDNIWVDQNLVPDMPGSVPGIEGHYSNSFFDGLIEPDGDIHFCAVLADSGHFENESEVLGLFDIHQVDGQWTADLICDGTYPGFNPREFFLDGDSWLHSPSLTVRSDGVLVASWNDIGWFEGDSLFSMDIWAAASLDGGSSWFQPVPITRTQEADEYFSKLLPRTTDEFAYVLTMYGATDGPLDL